MDNARPVWRASYLPARLVTATAAILIAITASAPPVGAEPVRAPQLRGAALPAPALPAPALPAPALPAPALAAAAPAADPRPPAGRPQPGTYTGLGFDACTAPSNETMKTWRAASPYRAVGIYIGGVNRGCSQPNLTAEWVRAQIVAGWHLMPLYVGLQAPCSTLIKRGLINPARAYAEGRGAANDAAAQARALGLARDSVLIYDMEAYPANNAGCRRAVLDFMAGYTTRLHDLGYASGYYSSMNSGIAHQVSVYTSPTYPPADFIDFARWDNIATVSDKGLPAGYWEPKRRMKQYRGGHKETWGGVTINIDNDYLNVAPMPTSRYGDFDRSGWTDILARNSTTGRLYVYRGNGFRLHPPALIGTGWKGFDQFSRLGDFNGDGNEDVIARKRSTGTLWMALGSPSGKLGRRVPLAGKKSTLREITVVGDFNRDRRNDLVAVGTNGYVYLYPGRGRTLGPRKVIAKGFKGLDELAGVGDFNRDGYVDVVARQRSNATLYLYPGRGTKFAPRISLGGGWNGMRHVASAGDFDRDGFVDLVAVQSATGFLFRYPGKRTVLGPRVRISTGWNASRLAL